jgi:hypothetical protein
MHELSERGLYEAIYYAKSIDQETGAKLIEQFQFEQTAMAQTLFGIFPGFIAIQNQEMSNLFMDLCFDVLCVFQHAFGPLPIYAGKLIQPGTHRPMAKRQFKLQTALCR